MKLFKKLGKILASPPSKMDRSLYFHVQCNRCGEKLRPRVDIWNELSPEFEGNSDTPTIYHCRKVLIGENKCYQPIELNLKFDKNHKLVKKDISGGNFIDEDEFRR